MIRRRNTKAIGCLRQQGIGELSKSEDSWADCPGSKSTCKKEKDGALTKCIYSEAFAAFFCFNSISHHDHLSSHNSTSSALLVASLVVNPTFARTINFDPSHRNGYRMVEKVLIFYLA